MNRKTEWLVISLLLLIALGLRFFRLAELMPFTFDQGRDLYALLQISRGDITLIGPTTGLQGVFLGPFYFYFLLPGFLLSGGSPMGVAYWVALTTTLALPLFYFILKPMVGWRWALLGFCLLLISFGSIDEARVIWNPSLAVPLLLGYVWSLFNSPKKPWLLPASALLYGLSLQTELAYTVFLFPALIWWVLAKRKRYTLKVLAMSIVMLGATLLPQVIFELRNNFIMTKSFTGLKPADYTVPLSKIWGERPMQIADTIQHRVFGTPGYYQLGFFSILMTVLYLLTKKRTARETFWVLVFILPIIGLMFHRTNFGNFFPYYLNSHYLPTLALLIIAAKKLSWGKWLGAALAVVMILAFIRVSTVIYNPQVLSYTIAHQLNALHHIRAIKQTDRPAVEVYVANQLPINYQYLNEWLAFSGKAEPVNFGVTDQTEYFLLYEGDTITTDYFSKPWYEKWTSGAKCTDQQQFGIITIERCLVN